MKKKVRLTQTVVFEVEFDGRKFRTDHDLLRHLDRRKIGPGSFHFTEGAGISATNSLSSFRSYELVEPLRPAPQPEPFDVV